MKVVQAATIPVFPDVLYQSLGLY